MKETNDFNEGYQSAIEVALKFLKEEIYIQDNSGGYERAYTYEKFKKYMTNGLKQINQRKGE